MSLIGTGYIIGINIDSAQGNAMRSLDFALEFYTVPNRREVFRKADLVHIEQADRDLYFAMLQSAHVGPGRLMCDVVISDPCTRWQGGARPVLLRRDTGLVIEAAYCRSTPARAFSPSCLGQSAGYDYDAGYRVTFNFVTGFPKAEVAYIFYGHLVNQITSYAEITQEMLVSPENHILSASAGKMGKTSCGTMSEGDKVVVLIPVDTAYTATKDNGFGGQMAFSTQIMGSNGENIVTIDGVQYRAYGEMMTTEGEMFIYVN